MLWWFKDGCRVGENGWLSGYKGVGRCLEVCGRVRPILTSPSRSSRGLK